MKHDSSKIRLLLFTIILLIVSVICLFLSEECNCEKVSDDYTEEESYKTVELRTAQSKQRIICVLPITHTYEKWNDDEAYLLAKIAMAEAEGEDLIGKAYVICVVLNRVQNEQFPDTIYDVIYQTNQFSPISDGRFDKVEPNDDCYKALEMVRRGQVNSNDALYFESSGQANTWHSRNLDFVFKHGGHKFYK